MRGWIEGLGDIFWLRPALLVLLGILLGEAAIRVEHAGLPTGWAEAGWIYAGGESGARALLGAIATASIGVAGTVFSITVAALSLASGQMGPRLLRNFTRDAGNQVVLGIFLGTFANALVVLRTVRAVEEGSFVPHLAVTLAVGLALLCVAALVWFVHHVASGINVETVIGLVHDELCATIATLPAAGTEAAPAPDAPSGGHAVRFAGSGYLRGLDEPGLADWAAAQGARLVLRVRPGDYLLPGGIVALLHGPAEETEAATAAFAGAASVGDRQAAAQDLEFAVRQLVEVGVRALSPGINDPFTAIAVIDRLGAALCAVASRRLPEPVLRRDDRPVLWRRVTDYDGLCDAMFHMIRQNGAGSAAVLIRLVSVLRQVGEVEHDPARRATLRRHAVLALEAGRREVKDPAGLADLEACAGVAGGFAPCDPRQGASPLGTPPRGETPLEPPFGSQASRVSTSRPQNAGGGPGT
nr:DUF2254 domain-containing protein [Roseomonas acroporae]